MSEVMLHSIRSGTRVFADGRGSVLHYSRRAINLLFGDRVVTLLTRNGILSPSSVEVDVETFPRISVADFRGDILETDRFEILITNSVDLSVRQRLEAPRQGVMKLIAPHVRPRERSISTALLMLYGMPCHLDGLEKAVSERELQALRESDSWQNLVGNLLGLGFGLTPSGDDFIVGAVSVLNLMGRDMRELRPAVSAYANPLSRTMLMNALDGHYVEPLSILIEAMAVGSMRRDDVLNLLNLGHTSGLDTLAGIYYALDGGPERLAPEQSSRQLCDSVRDPGILGKGLVDW